MTHVLMFTFVSNTLREEEVQTSALPEGMGVQADCAVTNSCHGLDRGMPSLSQEPGKGCKGSRQAEVWYLQ